MAPRRRPAPVAVALAVCLLLVPAAAAAVTGADSTEIGPGTVTRPAEGRTVVSVQGWVIDGETNRKKPARLAAAGPRARTAWVYTGTRGGSHWFYDVDPLPDGNLLVSPRDWTGRSSTNSIPGRTTGRDSDGSRSTTLTTSTA
jgi:hypothetical protein